MTDPPSHRASRRELLRYAVGWICAGVVSAVLLILALRGSRADDELPPVHRTQLAEAVRDSGCRLSEVDDRNPGNPPAAGPAAGPSATATVYDRSPPTGALLAATRRGIVAIHYRASLDADRLAQLREVQALVPSGTIVTPNATRMPYLVAAVAWHRVLGCRAFTDATLDALRLFRARNLGRGPDAAP